MPEHAFLVCFFFFFENLKLKSRKAIPSWILFIKICRIQNVCCFSIIVVQICFCKFIRNVLIFIRQVRNATAVFIINLSLSDLLFCCFNLPLAASTFWNRAWTHGELLCRLYPLLRYGLLAVSLFTVLAITINRYVMIGHPRAYPRFVLFLLFSHITKRERFCGNDFKFQFVTNEKCFVRICINIGCSCAQPKTAYYLRKIKECFTSILSYK